MKIIIQLPPVTKKNSQRIVNVRGRSIIIPSKKYADYEKTAVAEIRAQMGDIGYRFPITNACDVKCVFYMGTRRKCDLTNLLEAVDDVLVKAGLLEDDNFTIIASHDGSRVYYDKDNPRTEIDIIELVL